MSHSVFTFKRRAVDEPEYAPCPKRPRLSDERDARYTPDPIEDMDVVLAFPSTGQLDPKRQSVLDMMNWDGAREGIEFFFARRFGWAYICVPKTTRFERARAIAQGRVHLWNIYKPVGDPTITEQNLADESGRRIFDNHQVQEVTDLLGGLPAYLRQADASRG